MIVDDEPPISRMLQAMLVRFLSADVLTFNHPQLALNHFQENPQCVDLLISDLKMPDMDGMELCSRIKQIRNDLPIIILTAYAGEDVRVEASRIGVSHLVQKPFETKAFLSLIRAILDGPEN